MAIGEHWRGDSLRYQGPAYGSSLVGKWIYFTIKVSASDPDPGVLQKKFQATDTEEYRNQLALIEISAADMESVPVGTYVYDIQVVEDINPRKVKTIEYGTITIKQDITQTTQLPTDSGVPQVLEFLLPTLHTTSTTIPVTTFTFENATHYQFTDSATPPGINDPNWIAVGSYVAEIQVGAEGRYTRWAWVKDAYSVSSAFASQVCVVDLPSALSFLVGTVSVAEGSQTTLMVTRTGSLYGALTVGIAQAAGTAAAGDYTLSAASVTFASNDGATKFLTFTAAADALAAGSETATLRLTTTSGQASYGTHRDIVVTITDSSTQTDTIPSAPLPSFVAKIVQPLSTLVESNVITPTGYNAATAISVDIGEYRIDGGAWTSAAGTLSPGETVQLRHTTAAAYQTMTTQTVTIGGVSGAFQSTTIFQEAAYTPNKWVSASATGSGDGSQESPWTWQQAFQSSAPGDVIEYAPGIYEMPLTNSSWMPAFVPVAGTAIAPIVHYAAYRSTITGDTNLWSVWRYMSGTGPVCGMNDYVTFDGFSAYVGGTNNQTTQGGSAIRLQKAGGTLTGVALKYMTFPAMIQCTTSTQNWGALFIHTVDDVEVSDCVIEDFTGVTHENHSGIILYSTTNYDLHHNRIENCSGALFPKGSVTADLIPGAIHHNRIIDCVYPWIIGGTGDLNQASAHRLKIYQNLVLGGVKMQLKTYSNDSASNFQIVNNTFVGQTSPEALFAGYQGAVDGTTAFANSYIKNNIFVNSVGSYLWQDSGQSSVATLFAKCPFDYNMYSGLSGYFKGGTWLAWTAAMDANGAQDDPEFTNAAAGDYTLGVASPALDAGIDHLDLLGGGTSAAINLGCYILADQSDAIGPRAE